MRDPYPGVEGILARRADRRAPPPGRTTASPRETACTHSYRPRRDHAAQEAKAADQGSHRAPVVDAADARADREDAGDRPAPRSRRHVLARRLAGHPRAAAPSAAALARRARR